MAKKVYLLPRNVVAAGVGVESPATILLCRSAGMLFTKSLGLGHRHRWPRPGILALVLARLRARPRIPGGRAEYRNLPGRDPVYSVGPS